MGSPNFSNTSGSKYVLYNAFGYVPAYPTDEDVANAKESGWFDEDLMTDEDINSVLYQNDIDYSSELYVVMCDVADKINSEVSRLYKWGYDASFPYEVEVETGYHAGFSVAIVDRLGVRQYIGSGKYWDDVWDYHVTWDTEIANVELLYRDYRDHVDMLGRLMQWALENAVKCHGLQIITGLGYTQGNRPPEGDDFMDFGVEGLKWDKEYPELKFTF